MELRNLRHAVTLARKLSYTRAAEDLGLSQSALSRSIQALEQETGVRLFDRDRGKVQLTRHGLAFIERAEALVAEADGLQRAMRRSADAEDGEVCFGIESLPARVLLADVLSESLRQAPNLRTRVQIRSIEALWGRLIAGEIEFFISAEGRVPAGPPARVSRLGVFPLSFLVRPGHPALAGPAPGQGGCGGPFPVLLAGDPGQFDFLPPGLKELTAGPRHIVEDYETLGKLTERSDAILIASRFAVLEEMAAGRIVELPQLREIQPISMRIVMYSLDRRSLSPAALKLKQSFQRHMHLLLQA